MKTIEESEQFSNSKCEYEKLSLIADKLADALRDISKHDPVEMALDPQWAARIARITLTECGYEA